MYRTRRESVLVAMSATSLIVALPRRAYTPIYQPEPAADHIAPLRDQDEVHTLWSRANAAPSLGRAIELWLRYGNDPVLHTRVPPVMPDGTRAVSKNFPSASPFAYVEDYLGTNLVDMKDEAHVADSIEVWSTYFEKKYLMRLRQSRRTSASHIGIVSAPTVMADEADQPGTKWLQDTQFREVAFLSERHLKEKVANPLQLEEALLTKSSPEEFLAFFSAHQQETASRLPLPVPSVWVYEGEARKAWVERYLPAAKAAHAFMRGALAADVAKQSPAAVTGAVAAALKSAHAIQLKRIERQAQGGICPRWTDPATTVDQKLAWTQNACERLQRGVFEADFDPEDMLDTSEEWQREHAAITAVLDAKVEGCSFTLRDFWIHTLRREELETAHIMESERLRAVAAAAHRTVLDELHGCHAAVFAAVEDAVARGYLDLRAGIFQPRFNATYAKLQYAKFGASSVVQRTNTGSRELLYRHAASSEEVAAAATLYYATKPMSSRLSYASPYALRRSLTRLCAAYGVDVTRAAQRPMLQSAAQIAAAEGAIARVVSAEACTFGRKRRQRMAEQRAASQRQLSPVTGVSIFEPAPALLATGADTAAITGRPAAVNAAAKVWPLGAHREVAYHWPTPHLEKLKFALQSGSILTAARLAELGALRCRGRIEVSLWRQVPTAGRVKGDAEEEAEREAVDALVKQHPALAEVRTHAHDLFKRLSRDTMATETGLQTPRESAVWAFAVMLDDNAPLHEDERLTLYLPFTDAAGAPLPPGTYRVRVRGYDLDGTVAATGAVHPAMCAEAFSEPFSVEDVVPSVMATFFDRPTPDELPTVFQGSDIVALCEALRAAGVDVPLWCEVEAGQGLDLKGNIPMERFCDLLRSTRYHRAAAEEGITDVQRAVEPDVRAHWALSHPGEDAEEWAVARRDVLAHAMRAERGWWLPDPLLFPGDVVTATGATDGAASPVSAPSTARYGAQLCSVLSASAASLEDEAVPAAPGTIDGRLRAECAVDGTGAITSLRFAGPAAHVNVDDALAVALAAVQRAQDRVCTLSAFKLAAFEKAVQADAFCGVHSMAFGGKYARTYCYATDRAKREMADTLVSGRSVLGVVDGERERRSEATMVDRFASSTHPELRRKQFVVRTTRSGQNVDDPTPDQSSTWNH